MDYRERFELKEYRKGRTLLARVRILQIALVVLTGFFLLDFWYLQAIRGGEYARLAENNRLRKIPLPPYRGTIVDRHGEILASTRPSLKLVLRREGTEDLDGQIERLAPILAETTADLRAGWERMRGRPTFEPLVLREDVGLAELARIESRRERFPDVEVREGALRSYAFGRATAHVLGYIGEVNASEMDALNDPRIKPGDVVGKAGVEKTHDDRLRGYRGYTYVSVNNVGRPVGRAGEGVAPEHGEALRLTIDARLQRVLSDAFGDEAGAGVFLDPRSGEVLALVSAPAYDPGEFVGGISREDWAVIQNDLRRPMHNRAIASFYAPGSTFKVLMAIAGLETGTIDPSTAQFCRGSANIYGHTRLCWRRGGHGSVRLREALTHSCNVYFYRLGQALGIEAIDRYGEMFSIGRLTGIDLPGEQPGILGSDPWKRRVHGEPWYPGDTISVAIGQGLLAVTPMQMATMIAGVATGGALPVPHLDLDAHPAPRRLALHPERLGVVREALVDVVNHGTARRVALRGIQVAAKTGTAQVFKKSAGIDADRLPKEERDHAWLVGYAPADDPTIAFAVVVEHGGHGGTTAAPIARKVLETYFGLDQPGDQPTAPERRTIPIPGELTAAVRASGGADASPAR